ncbi:hypothetical protein BDV38DRAFT_293023 [Aspergillus pseudotamarii]|uniref:Fe2OG dioxygenase domain-containing protein n=1 Tax=Aspergillus pseudotamarii TaxID=132259 RepID=A0A5N6SRF7_ASPPS|nr:uncharacterized protein BDV38DRAFT_293023 [Aspergillus pseudotamarii]KAE8137268.1 hypothetical protein BDV38DRAFT_293023 [Aspergillus pseudotamarii]
MGVHITDNSPPFPNPGVVPRVANLHTVKFAPLLDRNETELAKLVEACEKDGFFYLDLCDKGAERLFQNLEEVSDLVKKWMTQPREQKCRTVTTSLSHGYKPTGVQSGAVESRKDGFEVLKVGRQELLGRWALQDVVLENLKLFDDFMAMSHFILKTLLEHLSDVLGFNEPETRLERWHQDHIASKSTLYFLNYPEEVKIKENGSGQNMHTDIGTLTLLFAPQWGLQVPGETTKEWLWVKPKPGHAIINVADTLRFLSRGRFRSALHRVLPIDGQVGDRFSISYFLRANNNTEFMASDGSNSSARDWYFKKYATYEKPHDEQKREPVLTGGMRELIGV